MEYIDRHHLAHKPYGPMDRMVCVFENELDDGHLTIIYIYEKYDNILVGMIVILSLMCSRQDL